MPCDPRLPYDLSLDCFADTPADERPAFVFRRLNCAEYNALVAVYDLVEKSASECTDELLAALRAGLMGWRNQIDLETGQPAPFDPTTLGRLIDHVEAYELINKRLTRARPSGGELKNSESPAS